MQFRKRSPGVSRSWLHAFQDRWGCSAPGIQVTSSREIPRGCGGSCFAPKRVRGSCKISDGIAPVLRQKLSRGESGPPGRSCCAKSADRCPTRLHPMTSHRFNPWRDLRGLPRDSWILALVTLINRMGMMVLPFMMLHLTRNLGFEPVRPIWPSASAKRRPRPDLPPRIGA